MFLSQTTLMVVTPVNILSSQLRISQRTSPMPKTSPAQSDYLLWVSIMVPNISSEGVVEVLWNLNASFCQIHIKLVNATFFSLFIDLLFEFWAPCCRDHKVLPPSVSIQLQTINHASIMSPRWRGNQINSIQFSSIHFNLYSAFNNCLCGKAAEEER